MSTCPSCGRYVGPTDTDTCPHCGARLAGRMTIRALQIGALALAVIGLGLLWWFATRSPIPTLKIGQAQSTMNFAYMRVEGQVTRAPRYDPDSSYLGFWVADDTGEMFVSSYRATTQTLVDSGRVPFVGDRVTVEGTLRIREDSVSLTLNSADALHIQRPQPVRMDIGQIDANSALRQVTIRGQVRAVRSPYKGLTLVTLRDITGEIDVAAPEVQVSPGQSAEATGAVTLYRDTPQVTLARADALRVLTEPTWVAPPAHVGQLAERTGQWVAVRGAVVKVNPFSAGVKFTLDDGTGRTEVVLWRELYNVISPTLQLTEGAQVSAQGEVSLYRGVVEIVPELPADVTLASPPPLATAAPTLTASPSASASMPTPTTPPPTPTLAPTPRPTPAAAVVTLGQLAPADKGKRVTARGKIVAVIPFSKGMKYRLDDGTGQVILLLWQEVLDQAPDLAKLTKGTQVSVAGTVDVFEGDIEVVPRSKTDVQVIP